MWTGLLCLAGERRLMPAPVSWALWGLVSVKGSSRPLLLAGGLGRVQGSWFSKKPPAGHLLPPWGSVTARRAGPQSMPAGHVWLFSPGQGRPRAQEATLPLPPQPSCPPGSRAESRAGPQPPAHTCTQPLPVHRRAALAASPALLPSSLDLPPRALRPPRPLCFCAQSPCRPGPPCLQPSGPAHLPSLCASIFSSVWGRQGRGAGLEPPGTQPLAHSSRPAPTLSPMPGPHPAAPSSPPVLSCTLLSSVLPHPAS